MSGWEAISEPFADAIRDYHVSRGKPRDTPSISATVRTNTELVPKRGDNLIRLLREMTGTDLVDRRVLELGCGFGALATYLAWSAGPSRLVATDLRGDFVETASRCVGQIGLDDRLRFVEADMRDLRTSLGHDRFDVVIANNSFIYLPTAADVDRALSELHEVLEPGGIALFYHANKWRWREPFTKSPVVHLLPPPLADAATRAFGWKHSHGRVRLLSPLELRRRLRRAGFHNVRIVGFGDGRHAEGPKRFLGTFYALSARRSE